MATHADALKRNRQNIIRRQRNRTYRTTLRNQVKAIRDAIEAGDAEKAQELLPVVTRTLHRTAQKGVIHRKNADRRISRIARAVNALSGDNA